MPPPAATPRPSAQCQLMWTLARSLENAIQLLVDVQIGHQSRTLGSMIGFSRRIERDRPHNGAQQERDNIDLNTHRTGDTDRARRFCVKTWPVKQRKAVAACFATGRRQTYQHREN
ncbi:hypothetical protein RHECNPAF_4300134 [Rhizobium etli CNPAF512]|nr:hypothetical protein RHECNPAF_4300134 [Rhizobium etli CNPAF512]